MVMVASTGIEPVNLPHVKGLLSR